MKINSEEELEKGLEDIWEFLQKSIHSEMEKNEYLELAEAIDAYAKTHHPIFAISEESMIEFRKDQERDL